MTYEWLYVLTPALVRAVAAGTIAHPRATPRCGGEKAEDLLVSWHHWAGRMDVSYRHWPLVGVKVRFFVVEDLRAAIVEGAPLWVVRGGGAERCHKLLHVCNLPPVELIADLLAPLPRTDIVEPQFLPG